MAKEAVYAPETKELIRVNKKLLHLLDKEEKVDQTTLENFRARITHAEDEVSRISADLSHVMSELKDLKKKQEGNQKHISSLGSKFVEHFQKHTALETETAETAKQAIADLNNEYSSLIQRFREMLELISKKQAIDIREITDIESKQKNIDESVAYIGQIKDDLEAKRQEMDNIISKSHEIFELIRNREQSQKVKSDEEVDSLLNQL